MQLKVYSKEISVNIMHWVELAQDRVRCTALANAAMHLHFTYVIELVMYAMLL